MQPNPRCLHTVDIDGSEDSSVSLKVCHFSQATGKQICVQLHGRLILPQVIITSAGQQLSYHASCHSARLQAGADEILTMHQARMKSLPCIVDDRASWLRENHHLLAPASTVSAAVKPSPWTLQQAPKLPLSLDEVVGQAGQPAITSMQ